MLLAENSLLDRCRGGDEASPGQAQVIPGSGSEAGSDTTK